MKKKEFFENTSLDGFLGGKISLFQPLDGYRANTDSILLAASVQATEGQRVLELGCGVGAVMLSLMTRINNLNVVGIELQKQYAVLANHNAAYNGLEAKILECDINSIPSAFKNLEYNHVILNPPFFFANSSMKLAQIDKDLAKREQKITLDDWLNVAVKRCCVKGEIVLIHQAARLDQILNTFYNKIGDIRILPICSFKGEKAKRVIVKGKKGSASPLQILPPFIMHQVNRSDGPSRKYTDAAISVLRNGDAINW